MYNSKDWQDQLAVSQSEYEQFFPDLNENIPSFSFTSSNNNNNNNNNYNNNYNNNNKQNKKKQNKYEKIIELHNISPFDFNLYQSSGKHIIDSTRRYSNTSMNYLETLDKLEIQFKTIVERIYSLQTQLFDPNITHDKILKYQAELAQLFGDLDKFQSEKVDAVISMNANTGQELVRLRRKSLNRRCNTLRDETESIRLLLSDMANAPNNLPDMDEDENTDHFTNLQNEIEPIPSLNIIEPDWSEMIVLQRKTAMNPLCKKFCTVAESESLPLCDAVFEYLYDPEGHAFSLEICSYEFYENELNIILNFLSIRKKLRAELQKLIIYDCNLNDNDCTTISDHIVKFKNLQVLNLRKNNITSEGFTEIIQTISTNQLKIKTIQFDRNKVDSIGMVELSLALPSCPLLSTISISHNPIGDIGLYFFLRSLLNKHRDAYHILPLPPDLQQLSEVFYLYSGVLPRPDNYPDPRESVRFNLIESNGYHEEKMMDDYNEEEDYDYQYFLTRRIREIKRRVKLKLKALFAFRQKCSRGHMLFSLRVENCNLSDYAASIICHTVKDNNYITDLFLSQNPLLLSTDIACNSFASLLQNSQIRILEIRGCGVEDETVKILSQGLLKSKNIMTADLSFNTLGSIGATWLTKTTNDLYYDKFSLSTVPVKSFAIDML